MITMKSISKSAFLLTLILNCIFAIAQVNDILEIQNNEKGQVKFARFQANANSNRKMKNDTVFLKSILNAKKEDSFRKINEDLDELGITHKKFQQYYKGLKVENSEFLIHGKNDNIEVINGDFQDIDIPIITPTLNEKQALNKALVFVGAKKYKWEDTVMENLVKQNTNNPNATYYPKAELVISKDYLSGSNLWKLSWKFTISSMLPDNEQLIYVDANDGSVINNIPLIYDANVSCTGQTKYCGPQNFTGDSFTGGYRLRESRNGVSIQTLNLHSTDIYASATDFVNSNTNWTSGSWANFNTDQAALDAHWSAEKVVDFWKTVFNRNSIDGAGLRVINYVHYTPNANGISWANAQWVSGSNSSFMQYGDGDNTYYPFVSLDVCAHEFGHGINQFTANLTYGHEESAALSEGFSDIWAACVEHWAAPNKQTWLLGEEIIKTSSYNCLRNLQNPKSSSIIFGQHPDTYHGKFWDNYGEPHYNSTVLSHWFYLLSQGGSGTNDFGNSFVISGIGIENAQKIAYRAETKYLYSSADYSAARFATILAAIDLSGGIPNAVMTVTNAWYAVGVGDQYVISGPSELCYNQSGTFSINIPGATISWTASGLSPYSGTGTTFTASPAMYATAGYVRATITVGQTTFTTQKDLKLNGYLPIDGPDEAYLSENKAYFSIDEGLTVLNWKINGQVVSSSNTHQLIVLLNKYYPGDVVITCTASSSCGTFEASKSLAIIDDYEFQMYPNPASDLLTVSLISPVKTNESTTNSQTKSESVEPYNIQLWHEHSGLIKTVDTDKSTIQIPLTNLPKGMYYVHLKKNKNTIKKQILWIK